MNHQRMEGFHGIDVEPYALPGGGDGLLELNARPLVRASVADLEAVSWHILVARSGTPEAIAGKLNGEMKRIMAAPDVKQKIEAIGLIPHESPSIDGMRSYIKAENEKWGALVRSLGLEGSE